MDPSPRNVGFCFVSFRFALFPNLFFEETNKIKPNPIPSPCHSALCLPKKNGLMDEIARVRGLRVETDHGERGSKAKRMRVDHLYLRIKVWGPLDFI